MNRLEGFPRVFANKGDRASQTGQGGLNLQDGRSPLELSGVWKVFGPRAADALEAIAREGLGKEEVLQRFGCVVGVADASFSVNEGEIFCVMGLSGSGKSTLVRLLNRLVDATAGEIRIHGEDIRNKSARDLRLMRAEKIGMVFQNFSLFPHRTAVQNVELPLEVKRLSPRHRREIATRALALVGLTGWENRFAHELSGGMQQRVGLARAMAGNPDILLMDEPFSALDPLIRRQLQDEFLNLSQVARKTTVFITHDLDEAIRVGDRIAIMKDGRIVQIGTPEQIVLKPADRYVSDFVSGISRLSVVRAYTVMEPIAEYRARSTADLRPAPCVRKSDDLNSLIDVSIMTDEPLVVVDEQENIIGVIEKAHLLRGIKGRTLR